MEVIELALNGNNRASEQLYKHIKSIIKYQLNCRSIFGAKCRELSHDLTVKVYDKLYTFKPEYKFKTWVQIIIRNALIDLYRLKKKNGLTVSLEEHSSIKYISENSEDQERIMIEEERSQYLEQIITELKPSDKYIIDLYYFEEYSQKRLANKLNMNVSAVNSKLSRIKNQLRKRVEFSRLLA